MRRSQGADLGALLEAAAAQDAGTAYRYRRWGPSRAVLHVFCTCCESCAVSRVL